MIILFILACIIFAFVLRVNIINNKKLQTTDYLFKELCKKDDVVYKFEDGVKWYADLKNINEIEDIKIKNKRR